MNRDLNKNQGILKEPWTLNTFIFILACAVGVMVLVSPSYIMLVWAFMIGMCIYGLFTANPKMIWYAIAMTPGWEILTKMCFVKLMPYETAKYFYFLCLVMLAATTIDKRIPPKPPARYHAGQFLLFAITPSLVYHLFDKNLDPKLWVFNVTAILQIGILLIFASKERWVEYDYYKLLKICVIPFVSVLVFLSDKSPKFDEDSYRNAANFASSGNFGPNQVSTCIGLVFFLVAGLLIVNKPPFKYKILNFGLVALALFRGLITFSRGGMIVAFLAVLATFFSIAFSEKANRKKYMGIVVIAGTIIVIALIAINNYTKNTLLARYEAKSVTDSRANEETDINKLTANRTTIAYTDLLIFLDYPVFGVGPGQAKFFRKNYGGFEIIAHTEYSRLLSEHGLGGILAIVILTGFPLWWIKKTKDRKLKAVVIGLYLVGLGNTFHAATRTNVTTLCVVLASLPVVYRKKDDALPPKEQEKTDAARIV